MLDKSSGGQLEINLNTVEQKEIYKKGDRLQYSISSNTDCYFSLLSFQADGTWIMLFPNRYESEILLRANTQKIIPNQGENSYDFIVDAPYGEDTIYVIASSTEAELTLKLKELTRNDPKYVSIDRGVFPIGKKENTSSANVTFWDVDWVRVKTSETGHLEHSIILPKNKAWVILVIGSILSLCGGLYWRHKIL